MVKYDKTMGARGLGENKKLFYRCDLPLFSILGDFFIIILPKSCKISHFLM